jgi:hypothetical protein
MLINHSACFPAIDVGRAWHACLPKIIDQDQYEAARPTNKDGYTSRVLKMNSFLLIKDEGWIPARTASSATCWPAKYLLAGGNMRAAGEVKRSVSSFLFG